LHDTSWPNFEELTIRHKLELELHTPDNILNGCVDPEDRNHKDLPARVALQTLLTNFDKDEDEGRSSTWTKPVYDENRENSEHRVMNASINTLNDSLAGFGTFCDQGQGSGNGNRDCFFEMLRHCHFKLFEKGLHMRWVVASIFFAVGRLEQTPILPALS
jgi:hypothetical protein